MSRFEGGRLGLELETGAVRVGCNYVEAVPNSVLLPDGEGDQAGHVAREEVAAAGLQVPVIALAEQLEARVEQLPLGLRCGVELRP